MTSPEALRKLADAVDALRDVEGIEVDHNSVEEVPDDQNPMQVMMQQMMGGGEPSTKEQLVITADLVEESEQEQPPYPDNPDEEELSEDAEEIEIEG